MAVATGFPNTARMTNAPPTNATNDNDAHDPMPFVRLAVLTQNVMALLVKRDEQPDRKSNEHDGSADQRAEDKAQHGKFSVR